MSDDVKEGTPEDVSADAPNYDERLVFDEDGKPWREKYHGAHGRVQQLQEELKDERSQRESAVQELQQKLSSRDSVIDELNSKVEQSSELKDRVGELQDVKRKLESKAERADRYRALMEYPDLLNKQVVDTVEVEGEEHEVLTNPFVDLIENTTLEGNELRRQIERLAKVVGPSDVEEEPREGDDVTSGSAPEPGSPMNETAESLRAEANKLRQKVNRGEGNRDELVGKMAELYRKAEEKEG